jgi:hypothetical protein
MTFFKEAPAPESVVGRTQTDMLTILGYTHLSNVFFHIIGWAEAGKANKAVAGGICHININNDNLKLYYFQRPSNVAIKNTKTSTHFTQYYELKCADPVLYNFP